MKSNFDKVEKFIFKETKNVMNDGISHGYLEGVIGMIKSKMYMEEIHRDIIDNKKYFRGKILDFGTGSGIMAVLMAYIGCNSFGIDIKGFDEIDGNTRATEKMEIDQKKIWFKFEKKYKNLKLSHYKDKIPFEDNFFDVIIAYAVLEHIDDKNIPKVMKEIKRVLKPNGHLLISRLPRKLSYIEYLAKLMKIGHHKRLYGDKEIINLLKKNSFLIKEFCFSDLVPSYPLNIINKLYPVLKSINKFLLLTPLKYFSHDLRILSQIKKP
jgi:2-polyprenyl-3-methyl-5-hydroxy-6-metoxy-1,4-benzoquinol methylase